MREASSSFLATGKHSPRGLVEEVLDALRPVDIEPTGASMEVREGFLQQRASVRHGDGSNEPGSF